MYPVWDLLIYLGCTQFLLLSKLNPLNRSKIDASIDSKKIFFLFSTATMLFWLVWGGYSVDAWRYLSRFDFNPLQFREEQLFWIAGYLLNKLVPDPWPIKILSTISILTLTWSYHIYLKSEKKDELILAYALLLATPGYFLLLGNTVRQGMAGSIEILGAVFFLQNKYRAWALIAVVGYLVHQFAVIVALAVLIAKLLKKHLLWIWMASFFVSPVSTLIFNALGYSLEDVLRYGDSTEGQFHWAKILVSFSLSALMFYSFRSQPAVKIDFRHLYIALSIISNTVLLYEVPFERLFLFSDLIAPLALGQILARVGFVAKYNLVLTIVLLCFSIVLWTNYSIVKSFGYL
jgi:hypothetical protein